jgi:hypothetical protein
VQQLKAVTQKRRLFSFSFLFDLDFFKRILHFSKILLQEKLIESGFWSTRFCAHSVVHHKFAPIETHACFHKGTYKRGIFLGFTCGRVMIQNFATNRSSTIEWPNSRQRQGTLWRNFICWIKPIAFVTYMHSRVNKNTHHHAWVQSTFYRPKCMEP